MLSQRAQQVSKICRRPGWSSRCQEQQQRSLPGFSQCAGQKLAQRLSCIFLLQFLPVWSRATSRDVSSRLAPGEESTKSAVFSIAEAMGSIAVPTRKRHQHRNRSKGVAVPSTLFSQLGGICNRSQTGAQILFPMRCGTVWLSAFS